MKLTNTCFRERIAHKPEGAITLGFLDFTLTFGKVNIEINGAAVRLTSDGRPAVSFPSRPWEGRDGTTRYTRVVRLDENAYARLVRDVFALALVQRAVHTAEHAREAA